MYKCPSKTKCVNLRAAIAHDHEVLTVLDKLADYAKELLSKNLLLFQRGNATFREEDGLVGFVGGR